ncbi:MAG: hypothetical protein IH947_08685 [Bacteroidetes bacterium]|nr:hypothetical protein [Bacteroidota bacterium]MCH8231189.1 hypothetical protein [Bacteroidota bacterium]
MAENTYKIGEYKNRGKSIFRWIEQWHAGIAFDQAVPVKYIPHVIFFTFLGVVYVGNTHYAESTQRKVNILQIEVEDMRADYTTLKAEYMYARLQSEVAKKVKDQGLEESKSPPYKIVLKKSEH